jgi:two-component system NtrC family sensor kinase
VPLISGSPQELTQVFLNLVINAAQAVGHSGQLEVRAHVEDDGVIVCVEDDGCGISVDMGDRIFDPFFTTKAVGEGSGLGLAISHEIVRRHGGEIRFESPSSRGGAAFFVHLPLDSVSSRRSPSRADALLHCRDGSKEEDGEEEGGKESREEARGLGEKAPDAEC